ncbi:MAG: hypothetical protein ABSB69_10440 [Solirubrobacteraceae bacterium]
MKLFSAPFPAICPHRQLVYGPQESVWFLLRACEGTRGGEVPLSGVGRLPLNGPSALLVRRLDKPPSSLTVGPEGDLWFTEDTYEGSEGAPAIGRLTASGQLTQFPTPVEPNPVFPQEGAHQQPGQISAGPENDLWFTAEGFGTKVLSRITPAGVLSQFPPQLVPAGKGETGPKQDEIALGLAEAGNGDLWLVEETEKAIGLVEPGGAIRQVPVAEGRFKGVVYQEGSDPIVGTADGGVWFVEHEGFTRLSASGAVVRRVLREEEWLGAGRSKTSAGRYFLGSLAATPDGVLWVSQPELGDILKRVTSAGGFGELVLCNAKETPEEMTVGPEGDIWFAAREGNFGRLDVPQLTGELERDGTQVQVCGAKATPQALRASVACESLSVSSTCNYGVTVALAGSPRRVVGVGRFVGRAIREPGSVSVSLRPVVRALLRRRGRLSLRLTLWSGAQVATSRVVVLRR